jgi:DNA-binding response OmpR family regulator
MSGERILVIDDEADFLTFVRRVTLQLDFEVEVTTDGDAFKQIYARFNPTVIVLDIVMPRTDGIELIRWLADMGCTARIVVISGFDPNYSKMAQTLGSGVGLASIVRLQKPVSVADLKSALSGTREQNWQAAAAGDD